MGLLPRVCVSLKIFIAPSSEHRRRIRKKLGGANGTLYRGKYGVAQTSHAAGRSFVRHRAVYHH